MNLKWTVCENDNFHIDVAIFSTQTNTIFSLFLRLGAFNMAWARLGIVLQKQGFYMKFDYLIDYLDQWSNKLTILSLTRILYSKFEWVRCNMIENFNTEYFKGHFITLLNVCSHMKLFILIWNLLFSHISSKFGTELWRLKMLRAKVFQFF